MTNNTNKLNDKELLLAKVKLLALIGVFGLPLLAAMLASHYCQDESCFSTQQGDLVYPSYPVPAFQLRSPEGQSLRRADIRGAWTLAYLSTSGCPDICQQQIYAMRQLKLMVGKEGGRVQRLFVYGGLLPEEVTSVHKSFPAMKMGTADAQALGDLAQAFQHPGASTGHDTPDRIYLLNPLAEIMLSYSLDTNPRTIYKDLKKLLKYSKLGGYSANEK